LSSEGSIGKVCGGRWNEKYRDYDIKVSHRSSSLKVMLMWYKDSDNADESGGFSQLSIFYSKVRKKKIV
jgi:hypothetical protein